MGRCVRVGRGYGWGPLAHVVGQRRIRDGGGGPQAAPRGQAAGSVRQLPVICSEGEVPRAGLPGELALGVGVRVCAGLAGRFPKPVRLWCGEDVRCGLLSGAAR